jgi:hypothetical protein
LLEAVRSERSQNYQKGGADRDDPFGANFDAPNIYFEFMHGTALHLGTGELSSAD